MPSRFAVSLLLLASASLLVGPAPAQPDAAGRSDLDSLPDDPAAVIAVVGESPILLGDLKPRVEAKIAEVVSKNRQPIPPEQLRTARLNLTRSLLAQTIQNKMMRESFLLDQVGTQDKEKRDEAGKMMTSRAKQMFFESEVAALRKKYKVDDLTELDDRLRESGSSLAARQREFVDSMLGHMYVRSNVEQEPDVSLAEIVEFYQTHLDQYEHGAKAKWEQLTVLFSRFSTREQAHAAISEMGREAYFGGNMQAVARDKSQEPFAGEGGLHDWTSQGSLASQTLDEQVFSLPLNRMSQIIEDDQGYHIIRVLARKPPGVTPLSEVQEQIQETIQKRKVARAQQKVIHTMRNRVPVWSIFPEDVPGAKPLPRFAERKPAAEYR
jgi:hypothetical protein